MNVEISVIDSASGRVLRTMSVPDAATADLQCASGETWVTDKHDAATEYRDQPSGAFIPRPTLPAPSAAYDLTALPAGSVVTVRNEDGDVLTITDLTGTLTLTDPGAYRLSVMPPFPYQPISEQEVTVDA